MAVKRLNFVAAVEFLLDLRDCTNSQQPPREP
jgi:hypothetical protein